MDQSWRRWLNWVHHVCKCPHLCTCSSLGLGSFYVPLLWSSGHSQLSGVGPQAEALSLLDLSPLCTENSSLQKPGSLVSPVTRKVRSAGFSILALLLTSWVSIGKSVYLGLSVLICETMMTIFPHGVVVQIRWNHICQGCSAEEVLNKWTFRTSLVVQLANFLLSQCRVQVQSLVTELAPTCFN